MKYVTITLPDNFKILMDDYAKRFYMSRSQFIRVAVLHYITFLSRKVDKQK